MDDQEALWIGLPRFLGQVEGWTVGPWWEVDLSFINLPGRYVLWWCLQDEAWGMGEPFSVLEKKADRDLVSDLLFHFKGQRCSGIWDEADRRVPRHGDGRRFDMHGGWYDASGDCSKYLSHLSYTNFMNPQQTPLLVWVLAQAWKRYHEAGASPVFLERLRDEATYGADFLVRMQDPSGFWYMTLFDRWSKDPEARELCAYRTQEGHKSGDFEAGWRQGGGLAVAALASVAALGLRGEYSSDDYGLAARRGFAHLREHGRKYLDDGDENIIDDTCALLAACELAALGEEEAKVEAVFRLDGLDGRQRESVGTFWMAADRAGDRSWFHASDAGLPGVVLARLLETGVFEGERIRTSALLGRLVKAQIALGRQKNNPFQYPPHWVRSREAAEGHRWFYPHANPSGYWWQGENARLASLAAMVYGALGAGCDDLMDTREVAQDWAGSWLHWILGRNPFDVCMMQGRGRRNPVYPEGENVIGGVCNGITAGMEDERDIAFAPRPWCDDPMHSWRWGEQWLPHGAWLLYALALRDTPSA